MFRAGLILFLSLQLSGAVAGVIDFNQRCRDAYEQMFALHFDQAYRLTAEEKKQNPGNGAAAYIEHYADFLRAFISEEEKDFNNLKNRIDERLELIDEAPSNSPWKKMLRAEMLLQLAVIKFKWKEYITCAYYFRKSFLLLEENRKQFPSFSPNLKSLGFFHAAIGTVPDNYKWLSNLIGLRGTIPQGRAELDQVLKQVKNKTEWQFLYDETAFLKAFVEGHFMKDYESAARIVNDSLFGNGSSGGLHVFIKANTFNNLANAAGAIETISGFRPARGSYPLHYLNYMQGSYLLNRLDFESEQWLARYTTYFKGGSFVKSAWQKLAWIRLLKGDEEGYFKMMEKVRQNGTDFTDEDKQALKEAGLKEKPNVVLIKCRLLFDGGLFTQSLKVIGDAGPETFTTPKDKAEVLYRLARIYDKLNQQEKALEYYLKTYETAKTREWYFAANSALLTGLIYENNGDKAKAREWYKKTLALRNHEYQNSIDSKAEAGLERVGRRE